MRIIYLLLIVCLLGGCRHTEKQVTDSYFASDAADIKDKEYADIQDKMFSMIFDLHSEKMGFDRTEQICGFGPTMKERSYAIYKGIKYYPDKRGFIIINTNK